MFQAVKKLVSSFFASTAKDSLTSGTRSGQWPAVRKRHLAEHPRCAACGGKEDLEVHHITPFHLHPNLELDPANLLTLCEKPGHGCHFTHGHFWCWQRYNPEVVQDAAHYFHNMERAERVRVRGES